MGVYRLWMACLGHHTVAWALEEWSRNLGNHDRKSSGDHDHGPCEESSMQANQICSRSVVVYFFEAFFVPTNRVP